MSIQPEDVAFNPDVSIFVFFRRFFFVLDLRLSFFKKKNFLIIFEMKLHRCLVS